MYVCVCVCTYLTYLATERLLLINKTNMSSWKVELMQATPFVLLVITPNPTPFYRILNA